MNRCTALVQFNSGHYTKPLIQQHNSFVAICDSEVESKLDPSGSTSILYLQIRLTSTLINSFGCKSSLSELFEAGRLLKYHTRPFSF